jgi:hypothetical protein
MCSARKSGLAALKARLAESSKEAGDKLRGVRGSGTLAKEDKGEYDWLESGVCSNEGIEEGDTGQSVACAETGVDQGVIAEDRSVSSAVTVRRTSSLSSMSIASRESVDGSRTAVVTPTASR